MSGSNASRSKRVRFNIRTSGAIPQFAQRDHHFNPHDFVRDNRLHVCPWSSVVSRVFEPVLPEPRVQLYPRDAEQLGRPGLVAIGIPHGSLNHSLFDRLEIGNARQWNLLLLRRAQAEVRSVDDPAIAHDQGALEHVPQFTDIA